MENKDLISIVVPIYNVEKYLRRCVDSIIKQTYSNIEIQLIDDGSTDNSGHICDEYKEKDSRIKVIHKENGGLSDSRNIGIENSNGKYITFIDSDDYIREDYIEVLYGLISKYNAEISICAYNEIINKRVGKLKNNLKEEILNKEECLARMLQEKGFTVSACAKMYLLTLFSQIKYPVGKLYEDNATTYKLIMKCNKIVFSPECIYNYVIRKDSITTKKFSIKKLDYIYITDEACKQIEENFPNLKEVCEYRKVKARASILKQMLGTKLNKEEKIEEKKIICYLRSNFINIYKNKYSTKEMKFFLLLLKINKNILKIGVKVYEKIK